MLRSILNDEGWRVLLELRVENYAVVDNLTVEFGPGLNLLTGETGGGKSILIDALALLLGDKASPAVIRHGAEKAVICGVFQVLRDSTAQLLEEGGIDVESSNDSDQIILRREIMANGKGRVFVNNQPATVSMLRQLAPELASIHAQNQTILAFDASERLHLLDSYAGTIRAEVKANFVDWSELCKRLADLEAGEQDRLKMLDLWSFQNKEIESARLKRQEDQQLEAEKRVLANSEKLQAAAATAYDLLYDANPSVEASLRAATRHVEELARYAPKFKEHVATLEAARVNVQDVSATLRDYADAIDASPERLAEVEDRLALLDRLKRKYGSTLEEVIAYGEEVSRKLRDIENRDWTLADLRQALQAAAEKYLQNARAISQGRQGAAKRLEKLVETQINELAMKAKFEIVVEGSEEETNWTPLGFDSVIYNIAANPGEPLKPIEQIASGGELSRVMLALKTCVEQGSTEAHGNGRPKTAGRVQRTLVFDEIDSGIGGRAAEAVGSKLQALSRHSQVLCITHLPQIAAFADRHFVVEKNVSAGRTKTSIRELAAKERREEIARMLSGAKVTETSLRHAEHMLSRSAGV